VGAGKNTFLIDNSASVADIMAQVGMDRAEMRLPTLFDGRHSIEAVVRASGLPELSIQKIAFTLSCFGALRPVESEGSAQSGARVRDLGIERERIQSRYALAIESDYFTVLGVDRLADANDIRRAYVRLGKEIAPEAVGPELWHELKDQIEIIQEVLNEGLRILSTPALRSAYEFNLAHGPDADSEPDPRATDPAPSTLFRG
jgi:hypothetical protein